MSRSPLIVLAVVAAMIAAACGKKEPEVAPTAAAEPVAAGPDTAAERMAREAAAAEEARRAAEEAERIQRQREADSLAALGRAGEEVRAMLATMVHFDYDRAEIRPDDASGLDAKVAILQANPNLRIRVHGHCDERGSDEYNLALGNRRATAVKAFLVNRGIDGSRIETQSWGEERPIAQGMTEEAWSQNRRAEFEIVAGGDMLIRP
jgi:peptidoglycan-associated lipoprotein